MVGSLKCIVNIHNSITSYYFILKRIIEKIWIVKILKTVFQLAIEVVNVVGAQGSQWYVRRGVAIVQFVGSENILIYKKEEVTIGLNNTNCNQQ